MQELLGIGMIDARMSTVFDTHGLPSEIVSSEQATQFSSPARWGGTEMTLPEGDWQVSYGTSHSQDKAQGPMWRNPNPDLFPQLEGVSRIVLYAKANVGTITLRRYPLKTTYDVPKDPLLSHKVTGVRVEYRDPILLAAIVACYGSQYDSVEDESNVRLIRYWVLRREGDVPLSLFAVDFELNVAGDAVIASVASSTEKDFVRNKLQVYFDKWQINLYD